MWRTSRGGEAERLDLRQRRLLDARPRRPISFADGAELPRVAGVLDAEAGVDAGPARRRSRSAGSGRRIRAGSSKPALAVQQPRSREGTSVPQLRWWILIPRRESSSRASRECGLSLAARRSGGIGIRDRLKIDCPYGLVGSSPTSGIATARRSERCGAAQAGCGVPPFSGGAPAP